MKNFSDYSKYYDLLNEGKNYRLEVDYLLSLIKRFSRIPPVSLLELGCGTGLHGELLKEYGLKNVVGIDLSEEMLKIASQRAKRFASEGGLKFLKGDVRTFRADTSFDVVTSLFHVLSYQLSDDDLDATFKTAASHLDEGGLFIFDFWYGPAVLWQRPSLRVRRYNGGGLSLTRIAEPIIDDTLNIVDVNYSIYGQKFDNNEIFHISEKHSMRYFFLSELDKFLFKNNFSRVHAEEWLTGNLPSRDTWGVCIVAQKFRT